ncbi:MAG: hypothetical protein U0Q04_04640 [Microbacterium sp.]
MGEADRCLAVFSEVDASRECLVREALALVVGSCVHGGAVDQEAQRGGEVTPGALATLALAGEAAVNVGESCADAVLVPFEGIQVDGVGEVRCEQLLALVLEALAVGHEFRDLGRLRGEPFVERRLNLRGQGGVLRLRDGNVLVAVGDELLDDPDGDSPAGAVLAFGGASCADEVRVSDALAVGREVKLHP